MTDDLLVVAAGPGWEATAFTARSPSGSRAGGWSGWARPPTRRRSLRPDQPIGPQIALDRAEERIAARLSEPRAARARIRAYRAHALAGYADADFAVHDPSRSQTAA